MPIKPNEREEYDIIVKLVHDYVQHLRERSLPTFNLNDLYTYVDTEWRKLTTADAGLPPPGIVLQEILKRDKDQLRIRRYAKGKGYNYDRWELLP